MTIDAASQADLRLEMGAPAPAWAHDVARVLGLASRRSGEIIRGPTRVSHGQSPAPRLDEQQVESAALNTGDPSELTDDLGDEDDVVADMLAELDHEFPDEAPHQADHDSQDVPSFKRPSCVMGFAESILRTSWARTELLNRTEAVLLAGVDPDEHDPSAIEAAWIYAMHPERRRESEKWLRRVADDIVATNHGGNTYTRPRPQGLPRALRNLKVSVIGGVAHVEVREDRFCREGLGYSPYMEQTPPEVPWLDYRAWRRSAGARTRPIVWDITAGSGTSTNLLAHGLGCMVIATDLNTPNEYVAMADARQVGRNDLHRPYRRIDNGKLVRRPRPDLVLFDPPSRGAPTHAENYHGAFPQLDLAVLDRDTYIETLAAITVSAAERVRPGGMVSVLLRCGVRERQTIVDDDRLPREFLAAVARTKPDLRVVETLRLTWNQEGRVRQAGVGTARPSQAVRFLLGRPS